MTVYNMVSKSNFKKVEESVFTLSSVNILENRDGSLYYYGGRQWLNVNGGKSQVFVPENGKQYYVNTAINAASTGFNAIVYLDSQGNAIGQEVPNKTTGETLVKDYLLTVPSDAAKVVVNWRNGSIPISVFYNKNNLEMLLKDFSVLNGVINNDYSGIDVKWNYGKNVYVDSGRLVFINTPLRSYATIPHITRKIKIHPNDGYSIAIRRSTDGISGDEVVPDFTSNDLYVDLGNNYTYYIVAKKLDGGEFVGNEDIVNINVDPVVRESEIVNGGKEISILFVGNSLTQDAISYLPYMLKKYHPNVKFKLYMWYNGGKNLAEQYDYFINNRNCEIFSIAENTEVWTNTSNTMSNILNTYKFDIVSLQEYFNFKDTYTVSDLSDWNNCRNYIASNYAGNNALKFVSLLHAPKRDRADSIFNVTKAGNALILKNTVCEDIIPVGISVYRALSTTLDDLGDMHHLSPDGTHTQEGLPCLLQTFVALLWVLNTLGTFDKSVYGSKMRMTTAIYNMINVPGANLGSGVIEGSTAQNILAQEIAIKALKEGKKLVNDNLF